MSAEPRFLRENEVLEIHKEQIEAFGGDSGIRDVGMLQSALSRPISKWQYESASIFQLAAAYAFGIAKNHPFVDGNKRTAFMSAYVFLGLNGWDFEVSEAEVAIAIDALAAGKIDEVALVEWFEANSSSIES